MLTQVEKKFDKEEFLKGLGAKQNLMEILEVCITDQKDANRYFELMDKYKALGKGASEAFATMELREEKIDQNKLSCEDYETFYQIDPIEATQMLFWEHILKEDIDKYMTRWLQAKTLRDLYEAHEKSPYDRFMSFVL